MHVNGTVTSITGTAAIALSLTKAAAIKNEEWEWKSRTKNGNGNQERGMEIWSVSINKLYVNNALRKSI